VSEERPVDEIARAARERWEELSGEGIAYSVPWLDLDAETARRRVDPEGMLGEIEGTDVLCLAGGGGQQSAAFGLLGARVTVLDVADNQLARDRDTALQLGHEVRTVQGDMRDLSAFPDDSFDLVWHAHSLTFVPDRTRVFREVVRVLRPGGQYRLTWTNPFVHGVWEGKWTGQGYPISHPYEDGEEIPYEDPFWDFERPDGSRARVIGPREWRHALGPVVNDLLGLGLTMLGLWEDARGDVDAEPGTWKHFKAIAPPWLICWWRLEG
jgi:SAM-dependent methyltransferase